MDTFKNLFIKLLYLTPVGYLLRLMYLYAGEVTPGVYVHIPRKAIMKVYIKKNPLFQDRLNWLLNGGFLMFQGFFIVFNNIAGSLGDTYSWFAFVFGFVSFFSALFPAFSWEKRIRIIKLSFIEITVVVFLIITVIARDVVGYYLL